MELKYNITQKYCMEVCNQIQEHNKCLTVYTAAAEQ